MFFITSLATGIIILFIVAIFIGAVIYHLLQYQMPNENYRKPVAVIAVLAIIFIFIGYWIFSGVPWNTI